MLFGVSICSKQELQIGAPPVEAVFFISAIFMPHLRRIPGEVL